MSKIKTRKNDIQIDLMTVKQPYRRYIRNTIKLAKKKGVRVVMSKKRNLKYNDEPSSVCNGYFCDQTKELAVACGQGFMKWFTVFIHESAHMDQWIEQCSAWTDGLIRGVEAYDLADLWLNGEVEMKPKKLRTMLHKALQVELDCERRVIKKIKKLDLPMDTKLYAQRANAYVYFYLNMAHTRKWYKIGKEPYNIKGIVENMPTHLDGNYSRMPTKIRKIFKEHMK